MSSIPNKRNRRNVTLGLEWVGLIQVKDLGLDFVCRLLLSYHPWAVHDGWDRIEIKSR